MAWYFQDTFPNGTGSGVGIFWTSSQATTGASLTTQSGAGRWNTGTLSGYSGHQAAWASQIGQIGNAEILVKYKFNDANDTALEFWFRSTESSSFTSSTGYIFTPSRPAGGTAWSTAASFSYNNIGTVATRTFTDNQYYWSRVRVTGTTTRTLQSRTWQDGTAEPNTWDHNFTDSLAGIGSAGYIQINTNGGGSASGAFDIDYIAIGDGVNSDLGTGANTFRRRKRDVSYPTSSVSGIGIARTIGRPSPRRRKFGGRTQNPRTYRTSRVTQSADFWNPPTFTDWAQSVDDDSGLTDSVLVEVVRGAEVVDDAGLDDSVTTQQDTLRVLTDPVGPSDTVLTQVSYQRIHTDSAGLTDAPSASLGRNALPVDTAGLTDTSSASLGRNASQVDSAGVTDSVAPALGRSLTISDSAGTTDTALAGLGRAAAVTDSAGLVDTPALNIGTSRADTAGLTDSVSTSSAGARSITDQAGLTDSVIVSLVRAVVIADAIGVTDSLESTIIESVSVADSAGLTDAVVVQVSHNISIVDDVELSDSTVLQSEYNIMVLDDTGLTDVVLASRLGQDQNVTVIVEIGDRRVSATINQRDIEAMVADQVEPVTVSERSSPLLTVGPRHWSVVTEEQNG